MKSLQKRFMYEAIIESGSDGGFFVCYPELPDAFTQGASLKEALNNAAEVLELIIAEQLDEGLVPPEPQFNHEVDGKAIRAIVSVVLTEESIRDSSSVTSSEAAQLLGVGKSRVAQLAASGQLESYGEGSARRITLRSINRRLEEARTAGRPRKTVKRRLGYVAGPEEWDDAFCSPLSQMRSSPCEESLRH